jgi:CheY-like chemotaxis protein
MSRILIVDDEKDMVELLRAQLESHGYETLTAYDGEGALDKARSEKPDLIILDLMLPKIDGYKVCRMLKFDDKYKHIPIIMFTAKSGNEDKEIGQEVRADEYITKDIEPKKLIEVVNKYLPA